MKVLTALFARSVQFLASLTVEQLNTLESEAQEINNRLEAQQQGNQQLKADADTATAKVTDLEAQLDTANARITTLESANATLKAENNSLKAFEQSARQTTATTAAAIDTTTVTPTVDANSPFQNALLAKIRSGSLFS